MIRIRVEFQTHIPLYECLKDSLRFAQAHNCIVYFEFENQMKRHTVTVSPVDTLDSLRNEYEYLPMSWLGG